MRENISLALGQLILFFLTGSLDFQQAPGHWSKALTTSHVWDCQKLPQKSPAPEGLWELLGRVHRIQSGPVPGCRPLTLPAGKARPSALTCPVLPPRTFSFHQSRADWGGYQQEQEEAREGYEARAPH